jgi:hypothetical protein
MSVCERAGAASENTEPPPRIWQKLTRSLSSQDENNPYSPVMCMITLLIAGLVVTMGPAIHQLLAQS